MKKILQASVIILFVFLSAAVVHAQPDPENEFEGRGPKHEKLKLSEDQEQKIETLRSAHQKKMIDLKAELSKAKVDARSLRGKDNLTRPEVISSVEKINEIKNRIALLAANHRMDVYELLTPEQRKIWKDEFPGKRHMKHEIQREFRRHDMDE